MSRERIFTLLEYWLLRTWCPGFKDTSWSPSVHDWQASRYLLGTRSTVVYIYDVALIFSPFCGFISCFSFGLCRFICSLLSLPLSSCSVGFHTASSLCRFSSFLVAYSSVRSSVKTNLSHYICCSIPVSISISLWIGMNESFLMWAALVVDWCTLSVHVCVQYFGCFPFHLAA